MSSPIVVALDRCDRARAERLAAEIGDRVFAVKIHDLYLAEGPGVVAALRKHAPVWVDLKFHDIPATVATEVRRVVDAGVDYCTIHASGGEEMCLAAVEAGGAKRVIAVTALTSLDEHQVRNIYGGAPAQVVTQLAKIAADAGIRMIVCSPLEAGLLRAEPTTATCQRITPGIRPAWARRRADPLAKVDDQARTATPAAAIAEGATQLVIGRPIVQAEDPSAALDRTLDEIADAAAAATGSGA